MGFKYRGKTDGKDAWINYSISDKGIKTSASVKFGDDMTVNINKKRTRTTFNLGGGLVYEADRYHAQPRTPAKAKPKYRSYSTSGPYQTDEEIEEANRKFIRESFLPAIYQSIALLITILGLGF